MTRVDPHPPAFSSTEGAAAGDTVDAATRNKQFAAAASTPEGAACLKAMQDRGLGPRDLDVAARIAFAEIGRLMSALPPEVRAAINSARHEAIMAFLTTWAESIAENAQRDKDAAKKRAALGAALKTLEMRDQISSGEAEGIAQAAGIAAPAEHNPPPTRNGVPPAHDPTAGLRPPVSDARLRSSN